MKRNPSNTAVKVLLRQADKWGLDLAPAQLSLLERYARLLAEYDLANVIGTRDHAAILLEHVTDALSCTLAHPMRARDTVIDVGAGGGFPGIPLKIAFPGLRLTLLEATAKKARFLETAVQELKLSRVTVVNQRAEVVGRIATNRDSYDVALARALAALPTVVEYCAPFVKVGGVIIAMKGQPSSEELSAGRSAALEVGAELAYERRVKLIPEMAQKERTLVVYRKTTRTPQGIPRRVGLAKQRPLGSEGGR